MDETGRTRGEQRNGSLFCLEVIDLKWAGFSVGRQTEVLAKFSLEPKMSKLSVFDGSCEF